jgi:indole-3-glycerol phosphate synthase
VTGPRRFSQAISEGDGISLVVEVDGPEAAERAQSEGAEGVLVYSGHEGQLQPIRDTISVPILFFWDFETADKLAGADACIIDMASWTGDDILEHARLELDDHFELALRVHDEEQLEDALEKFDPELFVLAGKDQEALQRVLDLLPDVPAGKLAIADLPSTTRADVNELERVGVDAVIVRGGRVAELVGELPPEV